MRVRSIASRWLLIFAALWTRRFVLKQAIVWVCRPASAGFAFKLIIARLYRPSGAAFRPPARFGTPARRAARWGRLWGYAPFSAPLASPPKHPLKKVFSFPKPARATRLLLRELPSLAPLTQVISLRAALCQIQLSPWILFRFSQIFTEALLIKKLPLYHPRAQKFAVAIYL